MWRVTLALAYLSSAAVLSPCWGGATFNKDRKKAPRELTMPQFIQKLRDDGEATQFTSALKNLTGFPPDSMKKGFQVPAADAEDGASRIADVVFSASSSEDALPVGVYWTRRLKVDRRSETYYYHTTPDGELKKAMRVDGQLAEDGKEIRGSGKVTEWDLQSNEIRERFQREVLDFWLKGKGRRKSGSKAAQVKKS